MAMEMQPQNNPYDFIVNTNHKPKRPLLPGGNSKQARIFVVFGGVLVLIIVGAIVMSLITAASSTGHKTLVEAAQQQTEIIRVSKIGVAKARDPVTLNLAVTTNLSLQSDQAALLKQVKVTPKELALGRSTKTDIALTTAEQSNQFDQVFTKTIQSQLATYRSTLKKAYDSSSSKKLKATLADEYTHAGLLVSSKQ